MKNMKKIFLLCVALSLLFVMACVTFAAASSQDRIELYKQYTDLTKEVSESTGVDMVILPSNRFSDDDWVSTDEFKKLLLDAVETPVTELIDNDSVIYPRTSSVTITKNATTTAADNSTLEIAMTANVNVSYSEILQRMMFAGINGVNSAKASGHGIWTHNGYGFNVLDGGRTYEITISGKSSVAGSSFEEKFASVEFYCS